MEGKEGKTVSKEKDERLKEGKQEERGKEERRLGVKLIRKEKKN